MKDINFCAIAGRLGVDPAIHKLNDGSNLFVLSVGTSGGSADNKRTDWTRVNYRSFTDKEFAFLQKQLGTGTTVHVTGTLRSFSKKLDEGGTAKISYIQADSLKVLTFREEGEQSSHNDGLDEVEAAVASMQDPPAAQDNPPPPPQAHRPQRGRDAPAVAQQPKVQSAASPSIQLRPASGHEVNF